MLEIKDISKRFPGVQALDHVSFTVQTGEVHALVGENGAGKSTLMRILSGVYTDYEGEIRWDDRRLRLSSPRDAQKHGIAIIHQELNLIPELTIAENIFLGREPRTRWGTIDRQRMASATRELLDRLNLQESPHRPITALRIGERQLVEVAKALSLDASLLILDEPTSALSESEIERLFAVMAALKAHGVTMIYISHKFDEIFRVADRVTVLRDGAWVGTEPISEVDQQQLIAMMVGRPLSDLFPKVPTEIGDEVVRVEHLSFTPTQGGQRRSLHDISFAVRRGEIVGLAGLMGSGRTELLESIFGVHPRQRVSGQIVLNGTPRRFATPRQALDAGIALVAEDRKNLSLFPKLSVGTNITLAALSKFLRLDVVRERAERAAVRDAIESLRIRTPSAAVDVEKLSGGNQQKVVLAKCLLTEPALLLLDEPTRGIDVGAKAEIYGLISQLSRRGTGILMASSEIPELLAMCDRILVLCEGRLTAELSKDEVSQVKIMEAATRIQRAAAA